MAFILGKDRKLCFSILLRGLTLNMTKLQTLIQQKTNEEVPS
jgi:hypothetical protein